MKRSRPQKQSAPKERLRSCSAFNPLFAPQGSASLKKRRVETRRFLCRANGMATVINNEIAPLHAALRHFL